MEMQDAGPDADPDADPDGDADADVYGDLPGVSRSESAMSGSVDRGSECGSDSGMGSYEAPTAVQPVQFHNWAGDGQNQGGRVDSVVSGGDAVLEKLIKPQLGYHGAMTMMAELSKSVLRLKDDLFLIKFAHPSDYSAHTDSTAKRCKIEAADSVKTEPPGGKGKRVHFNEDDCGNMDQSQSQADGVPKKRRVGRPRKHNRPSSYHRLGGEDDIDIPHECAMLLKDLKADTTDPDPLMRSPFVESRHTFLEMCQYRRYQFDSLRRAKYSSLMLLYHLHHPTEPGLLPRCSLCQGAMRELRWHCDTCPHFEVCKDCYTGQKKQTDTDTQTFCGSCHEHELTPFRVTFAYQPTS
jgi:hypothetical protein